jgi:beta-lactam-binding protein with PASTA domain
MTLDDQAIEALLARVLEKGKRKRLGLRLRYLAVGMTACVVVIGTSLGLSQGTTAPRASNGYPLTYTPSLVGSSLDAAVVSLRADHLHFYLQNSGAGGGCCTVTAQNPTGGSLIRFFDMIQLVVDGAAQSKPLPDLIGQSFESVSLELNNLGLTAVQFSDTVPVPGFTPPPHEITAQEPAPGTLVSPGSEIILSVYFPPSAFDRPTVPVSIPPAPTPS